MVAIEETHEEQALSWDEWDSRVNWLLHFAAKNKSFRECDPDKRPALAAKLLSCGKVNRGALKTSLASILEAFNLAGARLQKAFDSTPDKFDGDTPGGVDCP